MNIPFNEPNLYQKRRKHSFARQVNASASSADQDLQVREPHEVSSPKDKPFDRHSSNRQKRYDLSPTLDVPRVESTLIETNPHQSQIELESIVQIEVEDSSFDAKPEDSAIDESNHQQLRTEHSCTNKI